MPRTRGGPTAPLVQGQQPGSSPVGCTTAPSAACAQDTTTRQQPHRRRVSMPPPARPRFTNRRCTAATCRSCPRVLTGPLSTPHFSYARSLRQCPHLSWLAFTLEIHMPISIPFRPMKKEALSYTQQNLPNRSFMAKQSCSDHQRGNTRVNINDKVQSTLYSSRIDVNLAIYHYFDTTSREHATGPERGQISTYAVTTRHDRRIEIYNLLGHRIDGCLQVWNKLQNSIR